MKELYYNKVLSNVNFIKQPSKANVAKVLCRLWVIGADADVGEEAAVAVDAGWAD
jgi:hypothetical protein